MSKQNIKRICQCLRYSDSFEHLTHQFIMTNKEAVEIKSFRILNMC